MAGFGFLILFGFSCLLFPCEGKVFPPSDGTSLVFARGSTERIVWSYDDEIEALSRRIWTFESSDGKVDEIFAFVDADGGVNILTSLFEIAIEKPATLVLRNINETYGGTYKFSLAPSNGGVESEVVVSIAVTPMVTVECSSPATVNTSDIFTCACKGQGGKPPANVTWYKGNDVKSITGKEEQILHVFSAKRDDSGTYRCEAKSHEVAKNDTEIELIVNYPPENVKLMLTRSGKSATIRCTAEARPSANFKIFLNQTKIVAQTDQILIIPEVKKNHVGYYTCFARNFLGNESSDREYLSREDKKSSNKTSRGTVWCIVVVSLVSGIIIGILPSCIFLCCRRKFRSWKPHSNPEPKTTEADTTDYQELDLSQMNTEDNYQSLRVNAASNEEESTFSELNKTKDVENNYTNL